METKSEQSLVIEGKLDRYRGLEIDSMESLRDTETEFEEQLAYNLEKWTHEGLRSVLIKFKPPKCHLMNVAFKKGFYFHHASQEGGYVLMCTWLDKTTANRIPSYASHYVGVGGIIINEKEEVLLIQEVKSPEPKPWKFPGGLMDPGETIRSACEREVLEETGVKVSFEGILGMREQLDYRHGASDFYIVCLMRPDSVQSIDVQDKLEVAAAKWVPLSELTSNVEGDKYRMFPNAFKFMQCLQRWLSLNRQQKVDLSKLIADQTTTDVIKALTLSHAAVESATMKKMWDYYLPLLMTETDQ